MLQHIDTIIFDLGGVILNISPEETERRFAEMGVTLTHEMYHSIPHKNPFTEYETGDLDRHQFCDAVRTICGTDLTDEQITYAWNGMILDFPAHRVEIITELKKKYRILLLSNTNEMHYENYSNDFKEQFGFPFEELFHEVYVSHEMGHRKPFPGIFEKLIAESGITPERSLFIDDTLPNVEAAREHGIRAEYLPRDKDMAELFQ